MEFLEKELENIIWETDNEKLFNKGLFIDGKKYRQLRLGNYGIADIITVRKDFDIKYCYKDEKYKSFPYLNITVFELKKDKIGIGAFLQSIKYCKAIKNYFEKNRKQINFKLNITLIGKEIDKISDFIFITDLIFSDEIGCINSINYYTIIYNVDGLIFKKEGDYKLINENF
jgi:hypothetical protein